MKEPLDTSFGWGNGCYEGYCKNCGTTIRIQTENTTLERIANMGDDHFQILFSVARRKLGEECDCPEDYLVK